jgi:putative ABC transport system permease protein
MMTIGSRYFEALGTRLARGRTFTSADGGTPETTGIVNERFAALHFPGEEPLGRRVRLTTAGQADGPEWVTIVGIAPNIRQRDTPDGDFDPIVYVPYASNPLPFTTILVRSPDSALAASVLREHVRTIDPDLPLFDVMTLDEALAAERWPFRVFGTMFTMFAAAALVLAAVGLYAVTAYSVAQRTREIGVRMALGAQSRQVWWLVTRRAALQLAVGLLIGMAGALGVGQLLQGLLVRTSPTDPVTLLGVPVLLVAVAIAAFTIPARRAMRLDPVAALRQE